MHVNLATFWALLAILALMLIDWALGIFRAIQTGTFNGSGLPRQLVTTVGPYFGCLFLLAIVQTITPLIAGIPGWSTTATTALFDLSGLSIVPKLLLDIAAKGTAILGAGPPMAPSAPTRPVVAPPPTPPQAPIA